MAKSNYLSGILFIAAVFICCGAGSYSIAEWNPESRAKNQDHSYSRARVKQVYDSQIGIRESGLNGGAEVEKYLHYVNLPKGNPWCAAFVCWVFGKAGIANPRTGWSPSLFPASKVIWNRESGTNLPADQAGSQESGHPPGVLESGHSNLVRQATGNRQPDSYRVITPTTGDVFGIYFPEKKRIAHVGFIDQWDGTWLITVEGNTNVSGSIEGDGVYRKRRLVKSVYKVARYIEEQ